MIVEAGVDAAVKGTHTRTPWFDSGRLTEGCFRLRVVERL